MEGSGEEKGRARYSEKGKRKGVATTTATVSHSGSFLPSSSGLIIQGSNTFFPLLLFLGSLLDGRGESAVVLMAGMFFACLFSKSLIGG